MTPKYSLLSTDEQSALFELMTMLTQADGSIRLAEEEAALKLLDTMGFTSEYARDFYVNGVHARLGSLAGSPPARRNRLINLAKKFPTIEKRRLAHEALTQLAQADDTGTTAGESALLAEIRELLQV